MYKRLLWLGRLNLEPHFSTQCVLSEIKTVFFFQNNFSLIYFSLKYRYCASLNDIGPVVFALAWVHTSAPTMTATKRQAII